MSNSNNSIAVIMITLNEAHNLPRVFKNLAGWADEIFVLDSYSKDRTVDLCIEYGVTVVQKKFISFGDQWNHALQAFEIHSEWVMKLDPDEILSNDLKFNISNELAQTAKDAFYINRRLWFMGSALPVNQKILRIWKKNTCVFSDSLVNEYPEVKGDIGFCAGELKHFDSPNLEHWLQKQNKYTSAEALSNHQELALAAKPRFFGTSLERRMFVKKYFYIFPLRYQILFVYHLIFLKAYKAGKVGWIWSRLRCDVYRYTEYKTFELSKNLSSIAPQHHGPGTPDNRCRQD
ncbi:glycosyltransferase family 2 protein [Gammaproteobacteria bacterium]|nr:glycosyltransferase family 2 protein [Gammaproteobacteria bacterium]|tara:strand:- start:75 stop:944 length:870 start_codon:yes stop_codon:yes gene_type:complete